MSIILKAKNKAKKLIPAVIHVDNSARVQTVDKKTNKNLYDLINDYFKLSGIPVLLNTSFNLKGEPIVETPRDAIKTFFGCGIDLLVLNSIVIMKNNVK
jgi:carbamoyltransferase